MNRKITALLAVLLIVAALFGCGRAGHTAEEITLTEFSTTAKATTAAVTTTAKVEVTTTAKPTAKKAGKTTTKKAATTTTKKAATTKPKPTQKVSTTAAKKAVSKHKTTKPKTTKKSRTTARKATTKPTAHKVKTTTAATSKSRVDRTKITVTIQCKEVLSNLDKLKEGHELYVPKSGYFITDYTTEYHKGDTVYTVLQRVCRENGIKLKAKVTVYGMYVIGINGLDEKDCGAGSGWTYYVNGDFPPVAVDKYTLDGGEFIEFKYVV